MKKKRENIIVNKIFKNTLFDFYNKKITKEYIDAEIKSQNNKIILKNIVVAPVVLIFSLVPGFFNFLILTYWLYKLCKDHQKKEFLVRINDVRKEEDKAVFLADIHNLFYDQYVEIFKEFRKELIPENFKKELKRIMTEEDLQCMVTMDDYLVNVRGSEIGTHVSFSK